VTKALCNANIEFGPIDPRLPLPAFADVYLQTFDTTGRIANDRPCDIAATQECGMPKGTVKWFNTTKGFGFIQPDEGGADVFVHISAVERSGLGTLTEGQKVNFEIQQDRRTGKSAAGNLTRAG
jgi:CspA family cold shock protein